MKLPLSLYHDHYGKVQVVDAAHQVVSTLHHREVKFAEALVRKFNRNPRYVLFGWQPYTGTSSVDRYHLC